MSCSQKREEAEWEEHGLRGRPVSWGILGKSAFPLQAGTVVVVEAGGCMPALSAHRWGDGQKWKYLVCSLPLTLSSAHITLVLFFHLFLK